MTKEFNTLKGTSLSEKIFSFDGTSECKNGDWITKSDVKEFIKLRNEVIEDFLQDKIIRQVLWFRLNRLAGEDLK